MIIKKYVAVLDSDIESVGSIESTFVINEVKQPHGINIQHLLWK